MGNFEIEFRMNVFDVSNTTHPPRRLWIVKNIVSVNILVEIFTILCQKGSREEISKLIQVKFIVKFNQVTLVILQKNGDELIQVMILIRLSFFVGQEVFEDFKDCSLSWDSSWAVHVKTNDNKSPIIPSLEPLTAWGMEKLII